MPLIGHPVSRSHTSQKVLRQDRSTLDGEGESQQSAIVELHDMTRDEMVEVLDAELEGGIRISFTGKANARSLARRVRPRVTRPVAKYGAVSV